MKRYGRVAVAALVVAWVLPLAVGDAYLLRTVGQAASVFALVLALDLVAGVAGLLDLGFTAFVAIGAYTYAAMASPHFGVHLPSVVVVASSVLAGGLAGLLVGLPSLRVRDDYLAIVTLGFGQIVRILLVRLDRPINLTNGPNGIVNLDPVRLLGVDLSGPAGQYVWVSLAAVVLLAIYLRLVRSRLGRGLRACRDDETAALSIGLPVPRLKLITFVLGAGLMAWAGAAYAGWQGAVFPETFDWSLLILVYCAFVLGRGGGVPGFLAASLALAVVPELLRGSAAYRMLLYGLVLMFGAGLGTKLGGFWRGLAIGRLSSVSSLGVSAKGGGAGDGDLARRRVVTEEDLAAAGSGNGPGAAGSDPASQRIGPADAARDDAGPTIPASAGSSRWGLSVEGLSVQLGRLPVLSEVSFEVRPGEAVGLIGPNGAGKTTLFNAVCGFVAAQRGSVELVAGGDEARGGSRRVSLLERSPHDRAGLGLARTFQGDRPFGRLTLAEAVGCAQERAWRGGMTGGVRRSQGFEELAPSLRGEFDKLPGQLTFAQRRLAEIVRALAVDPTVVLLDEPLAGLGSDGVAEAEALIGRLRQQGRAVLVVEHRMASVMRLCDRLVVLDRGRVIAQGAPAVVAADEQVQRAYLGEPEKAAGEKGPATRIDVTEPIAETDRDRFADGSRTAVAGTGVASADDEIAGAAGHWPDRDLLVVAGLTAGWGDGEFLHGVDLSVGEGEIVGVLGPNGAGKSTLLSAIAGAARVFRGRVSLDGLELDGASVLGRRAAGLALVPEGRRLFGGLTIREHIQLGAECGCSGGGGGPATVRVGEERVLAAFPHLRGRLDQRVATLSGGERQMVAVAVALAARPRLLLLDEPCAGLAPMAAAGLLDAVRVVINEGGEDAPAGVLLVEQNPALAQRACDRFYALRDGRVGMTWRRGAADADQLYRSACMPA